MTSSMTEPGLQIIWLIHQINVLLLYFNLKYILLTNSLKTHTIPNNPIMEGILKILKKIGF